MSTQLATVNVDSKELATFASSSETRSKFVCKDMLKGDSPQLAKAEAQKALAAMLANPLVIATYGSDALSGLNALIERMFKDIDISRDSEVGRMLKGLDKRLDDISHNYNAADPKFVAKYDEMSKGFLGIFGGAAAFWRKFLRDVKSVDALVNDGKKIIQNNIGSIEKVIGYYGLLKDEQKAELHAVIYQIAVMEYTVDFASEKAAAIPTGEDHDTSEERGELADLIKNLNNRIAAYKSRLTMGWTTSPFIRSQISANIGIHGSVLITKDITFPMIMFVMTQMALLRKSKDISDMNEAFRDTLNQALQQFAVNASVIVPEIERATSAPIMLAQTLTIMRDAYVKQTEDVIKIMDETAEQTAIIQDLQLSTVKTFTVQSDKVSDAVIDRAIEATRKLEISTKALDSAAQQ